MANDAGASPETPKGVPDDTFCKKILLQLDRTNI